MLSFARLLVVTGMAAWLAAAQPSAELPAFEVASVKIHQPPAAIAKGNNRENIDSVPGSLTMRNVNLRSAIGWAYSLKDYQISGPDWLNIEKYDILAKASGPVPAARLRQMLQTLLAERFAMRAHRETKTLPVYFLIAAKSGPKLHAAEPHSNTGMFAENGSFVFHGTSMEQFADDLASLRQLDRPVLDRTGIEGVFDFSLKLGDNNYEMKRVLINSEGASLFTLIQEQLGLRIEAGKGAVDMLAINHAERIPTEN